MKVVGRVRHRRVLESVGHRHVGLGVNVDAMKMTLDDAVFELVKADSDAQSARSQPVSYTHLTLPTILRV